MKICPTQDLSNVRCGGQRYLKILIVPNNGVLLTTHLKKMALTLRNVRMQTVMTGTQSHKSLLMGSIHCCCCNHVKESEGRSGLSCRNIRSMLTKIKGITH